ncbi:MAG: elongation factor 1-beta [Desulfurococcus sp.]|uniref:elongation factor 1-beta n=1 Tax=Desulfurococcus sp. TaxID=51678 RepID=UPI003162F935
MAQVLVIVRVLPEDVETPLDELRKRIANALPEGYELKMWDEEPIAFGLKALRLAIIMPEQTEGGTETLENLISQVQGVSQVEVEYVNRLS